MQAVCERRTSDSKTTEKMVRYTYTRHLENHEKIDLFNAMNNVTSPNVILPEIFPRFLTAYKRTLSDSYALQVNKRQTYLNVTLSKKSENSNVWWTINETVYGEIYCANRPDKPPQQRPNMTVFIFSERVSDNLFGHLFSNYGIIGMYAAYIFVAHRVLRAFYSDISYIIRCEELPHVDRILNLLNEIYLVRENKMFRLEEQLIAKLIYLYRSTETMIKWTRHKKSILDRNMENKNPEKPKIDCSVANIDNIDNIEGELSTSS